MSVPPCGLCFKAPNGYVPLAGFRSERAEIAFSPFAGGSQPLHCDNGSSLKLLYLKRDTCISYIKLLFVLCPPIQHMTEMSTTKPVQHLTSWGGPLSPHLWQTSGFSWISEPEDSGPERTTGRTSQPAHCSRWHWICPRSTYIWAHMNRRHTAQLEQM